MMPRDPVREPIARREVLRVLCRWTHKREQWGITMSNNSAQRTDRAHSSLLQQGADASIYQLGAAPFTLCLAPTADRGALAVDIFESADAIIIEGSIPGVRRDDVEIVVRSNIVTIRARIRPAPRHQRHYVRRERYAGGWSRTIELPQHVMPGAMTWRLRQGVVTLRIAKHAALTVAAPAERV
jgi:HSP20 family molecular chaperone IbpA